MGPYRFITAVLVVFLSPVGESRMIPDSLSAMSADVCTKCNGLLQMSANMISSSQTKAMVYEALHALCQRLPSEQASLCDIQIKSYLTKVLQQTPRHFKWSESCELFGLCSLKKQEVDDGTVLGSDVGELDSRSEKGLFNPVCTLCVLVIRKMESLLPKNMTEDALQKLMSEVCSLIPHSYKDQCDDFVNKYGVQIVEFLLSSAAPHTICTLLHLCLMKDTPPPQVPVLSDCNSCQSLSVLSRVHPGLNSSELLQTVCDLHPNAIPKCEAFTKVYHSQLQRVLGKGPDSCQKAGLCVRVKAESLLGENRCTWGPSYWCKDMKTAQQCGNQAFCKRHVWKK